MSNNLHNDVRNQMHSGANNGIEVSEATDDTIENIRQVSDDVRMHIDSHLPQGFTVSTTNKTQNGYVEVYITVMTPMGQQIVFSFQPIKEKEDGSSEETVSNDAESIKEVAQEFAAEIIYNRLKQIDGEIEEPVAM